MLDNHEDLKAEARNVFQQTTSGVKWLFSNVPPMHPAGWPFVGIFALTTALLTLVWDEFFWIGLILTAWCAFFFRNPARFVPAGDSLVIAPADGIVSAIVQESLPSELDYDSSETYTRVSIFLSVFDVHLQRVPLSGKILEVIYRPGKFLNASLDKASEENERSTVLMETHDGKKVAFVQIAGLIARRIINDLKKDQTVRAGDRYGLIRFGSRVDVFLPAGVNPQVAIGQRMIGGETVLADLSSDAVARVGVRNQ